MAGRCADCKGVEIPRCVQLAGYCLNLLIPELVKQHWSDYLLSAQHARRLRSVVLAYGGPRVVVIAVPWYLTPPKIEEAMTEEEAAVPFRVRNVLGSSRRRSSRKPA